MISSLAPATGIYVLLRARLGIRAALLGGLLAPAATTGQAAAWGGYPQLLSLGSLALLLWAIDRWVGRHSIRWAWIASLFLFLTVASNELVGALAVFIAIVFLVLRIGLLPKPARPSTRLLGVALLICVTPLLLLAPTYFALANGYLHNAATKGSNQHVTVASLLPDLNNLFKENVEFWYLVLLLALVSPLLLLVSTSQGRRAVLGFGRHLAAAATAVLIPTIAAMVLLGEVRFLFLLPIAIGIGLGAWWTVLAHARGPVAGTFDKVLVMISAVILFVESALGIASFQSEVQWYSALSPGVVHGLQELDRVAPRQAVLAVSPAAKPGPDQQGWPLGWWVEGLLDRPTYFASDLQWLNTQDERRRATLANEMFSRSENVSSAIALARANRINYIVVAKYWIGYGAWVSKGTSLEGSTVVIDTDSLLVISTSG